MSKRRLLREYCGNFSEIGSILPDSKRCVDALLRGVPFDSAKVIVEFGSACGTVTREIIRRKKASTLLFSFEKNPRLHAPLKEKTEGENVFLLNEDVFNCRQVLAGMGGRIAADCIVSTLPCSSIDFEGLMKKSVLPLLNDGATFIQYMHTISYLKGFSAKKALAKYFNNIVTELVLLNMPPTLVYTCRNG